MGLTNPQRRKLLKESDDEIRRLERVHHESPGDELIHQKLIHAQTRARASDVDSERIYAYEKDRIQQERFLRRNLLSMNNLSEEERQKKFESTTTGGPALGRGGAWLSVRARSLLGILEQASYKEYAKEIPNLLELSETFERAGIIQASEIYSLFRIARIPIKPFPEFIEGAAILDELKDHRGEDRLLVIGSRRVGGGEKLIDIWENFKKRSESYYRSMQPASLKHPGRLFK